MYMLSSSTQLNQCININILQRNGELAFADGTSKFCLLCGKQSASDWCLALFGLAFPLSPRLWN